MTEPPSIQLVRTSQWSQHNIGFAAARPIKTEDEPAIAQNILKNQG